MAIQVLDLPNYGAAGAGAASADAIGKGLEALLHHKIGEKTKQQTQKSFEKAGYPSHVAELFSHYSPEEQVKLLQSYQAPQQQQMQAQPQEILQRLRQSPQGQQILEMLQRASPKQQQQALAQIGQSFANNAQRPQTPSFAKGAATDIKIQNNIDRKFQKYNDSIDNARDNSDDIINVAEEMKSLAEKGNLSEGLIGDIREKAPFGLAGANEDTREFVSQANDLIDKSSNLIKGIATNFKIKLKQAAKINLGMPQSVKIKRLNQVIDSAHKAQQIADIRDQIIQENGNQTPDNLPTLVRKRYQQWNKEESKGAPHEDPEEDGQGAIRRSNGLLWTPNEDLTGWVVYKGKI